MQDGVPTPYINIRFYIIYPINSHGITSLYLLNQKVTDVKDIIYNMNHKSI